MQQGQTVTFQVGRLDLAAEPHTVTVVDEGDMPTTAAEVFACEACGQALEAHFPSGEPGPETMEPEQAVVEEGEEGLDAPGDSLWLGPGEMMEAFKQHQRTIVALMERAPASTQLAQAE